MSFSTRAEVCFLGSTALAVLLGACGGGTPRKPVTGSGGIGVGAETGGTKGSGGTTGTGGAADVGGASGTGATAATGGGAVAGTNGGAGRGGGTGDVGGSGATAGAGGAFVLPAGPLMFDVSTTANSVAPGKRILYTVTVGNVSTRAVDGVTVSLLLPTGLQFHFTLDSEPNSAQCGSGMCTANSQATWTLGSLAAGASRTIVVNAQVLQTVGDGDSVATSFKLSATGANDIVFPKVVQVYSQSSAQLSTGTATYPLTPGQRFTVDLDVGQVGATPLTGALLQASLAPGLTVASISSGGMLSAPGVVQWNIGGLGVGAAVHREVDVVVNANVPAGAVLGTSATLMYDGGLAVDAVADYAVAVAAMAPALSVAVAATPHPATPSGRLAYTVTVTNRSPRAVDGVVVQVRVPSGLQFHFTLDSDPNSSQCGSGVCAGDAEAFWSIGSLAPGASQTVVLNPEAVATVIGSGNLLRASFVVTAMGMNELNAVKTVPVHDAPAVQFVLASTANPVTSSQAFTYNFDIGQIGLTALTGAELRARLPPGLTVGAISNGGTQTASGELVWAIGDIGVGAGLHLTASVTGDGTAAAGNILMTRAALTYDGGAAVDTLAENAVSVVGAVQPLALTVSSPTPAKPGSRLLYTATVANTSARSVDGVVVLLRVPVGLQFHFTTDSDPDSAQCGSGTCDANAEAFWTIGTMAVGASQTISVNAQVLPGLLAGSLVATPFRLAATGLSAPILLQPVVPAHL